MFYVNDEPEEKCLCTEMIKLYQLQVVTVTCISLTDTRRKPCP